MNLETQDGDISGKAPSLIAVIEDEQIVLLGYEMLFEGWGYEVASARCGDDLLSVLEQKRRRPDAILADYRLQEGCTGVMEIRRVQEAYGGSIPAILVTGDTTPSRLSEVAASGYPVLHKPVDGKRLRRLLDEIVGRSLNKESESTIVAP